MKAANTRTRAALGSVGLVRRIVVLLAACGMTGTLLTGCASTPAGPEIVVTTNILGDVVHEIVGEEASVEVLMQPNADPHSFGISAQQTNALRTASLIVSNGLGLEEGLQHHVDAAANAGIAVLAVGEHVDPLPAPGSEDSGQWDPHFWTDPSRMRAAVDVIEHAVVEQVPGIDADRVHQRAVAYAAKIQTLENEMSASFAEIPAERRKLITNHHVFAYFAEAYDFTVVGAIIPGGTTLSSPSASDLAELVSAMQENEITALFIDSSHPARLAEVLAAEAGVQVDIRELYSESLGVPGSDGDTYLHMMRFNSAEIADALT